MAAISTPEKEQVEESNRKKSVYQIRRSPTDEQVELYLTGKKNSVTNNYE